MLLFAHTARADDSPYGNLKLLSGYKYKRSRTFDTVNGLVYKEGGLQIEFESGTGEGYAADPKRKEKYLWFRQQQINGRVVFVALASPGEGIVWEPKEWRGSTHRRILIVTFPGDMSPLDAANFYAEILDDQEIADVLLMVLTFDPTK